LCGATYRISLLVGVYFLGEIEMKQLLLFPPEYYIGSIAKQCDEAIRIKEIRSVKELIKITPMLNDIRRIIYG
jgi:hypothetical protein